jgi:CRP-like cAMP-binding protein
MPFRTGAGHYDAAAARDFFKRFGRTEKFDADIDIFVQNEKSNKQSIFKKPVTKALTAPLSETLFARKNIHRMYLLTSGEVTLSADGAVVDRAQPGDVFGEMAVLSEIPDIDTPARRSATAHTAAAVECFSLDGDEVQAGLGEYPEFALMLMSVMFERLRAQVAKFAQVESGEGHRANRMVPTFNATVMAQLHDSLGHQSTVRFREGDRIIKEGAPGTTMYAVLEGEVAVAVGRRIIEKLGPGGVFGEMALVDQLPRAATAVARAECILLSMNRPQLVQLVKANPTIGMAMMRAVAERVRYMNAVLEE